MPVEGLSQFIIFIVYQLEGGAWKYGVVSVRFRPSELYSFQKRTMELGDEFYKSGKKKPIYGSRIFRSRTT